MDRRVVLVEPERLAGWFDRFGARHDGVVRTEVAADLVRVVALDGAAAEVAVPFAPLALPAASAGDGLSAGAEAVSLVLPADGVGDGLPAIRGGLAAEVVDALVAHLGRPWRVALLLVRLGGHSVGVAVGGAVELSATDRRLVHGRNRAGGQSSGRFARRREGQARAALQAAADTAVRVLLPRLSTVDAVVLGGDRRALDQLRADRRLAPLFDRAEPVVLDVPEPRRTVLDDAAERVRCARIVVTEP